MNNNFNAFCTFTSVIAVSGNAILLSNRKLYKNVDKVIEKSPLTVDIDFIKKHKIDLVVHGFASEEDEKKQEVFFKEITDLGLFKKIKYYDKTSTTSIINKIKSL